MVVVIILSSTPCPEKNGPPKHIKITSSNTTISEGSVAMRLRCGGIFNDHFIANFQEIVTVKEFRKLGSS